MVRPVVFVLFIFFQNNEIATERLTLLQNRDNNPIDRVQSQRSTTRKPTAQNEIRNERQMTFYVPYDNRQQPSYNTDNNDVGKRIIKSHNSDGRYSATSGILNLNKNSGMRYRTNNGGRARQTAMYNNYRSVSSNPQMRNYSQRRYSTLKGGNANPIGYVRRPVSTGFYQKNYYRQGPRYSIRKKTTTSSSTKRPNSRNTHKKFKPSFVMM